MNEVLKECDVDYVNEYKLLEALGSKYFFCSKLVFRITDDEYFCLKSLSKFIGRRVSGNTEIEKLVGGLPKKVLDRLLITRPCSAEIHDTLLKIVSEPTLSIDLLKQDSRVQEMSSLDNENKLPFIVYHCDGFNYKDLVAFESKIEFNNWYLISVLIKDTHVIAGPLCKSFGTPKFYELFETWHLYEGGLRNESSGWSSVLYKFRGSSNSVPSTVTLTAPVHVLMEYQCLLYVIIQHTKKGRVGMLVPS